MLLSKFESLLQSFESNLSLNDFNSLLSKAKDNYGYPRADARLTKNQKLQLHKIYCDFKLQESNVDQAIEELKSPSPKFPLNLIFNFKLPEPLILKLESKPLDYQKFLIVYKKVLDAEFLDRNLEIKNAVLKSLEECYA